MSSLRDRLAAMMPKRVEKEPAPAGVIPAWLVWQTKALAWIAMASLVYFLWLFSLDAARDAAQPLHITRAGTWTGNVEFWFPTIIGFILIAIGVPWLGKIVIPAFVSLRWKEPGQGWPKFWLLVLTLAGSAVIIAGSITVQTETRFERARDGVVAEETREAGVAALRAQLAAVEADLDEMTGGGNRLTAQAARAGQVGWEAAIEAARRSNAPLMPQREAAMGSAIAADNLRKRREELIGQIAAAPTAASVKARVTATEADAGMASFMDWLASVRAIMLAVLMDIICLLMPWIALRLEQARARQLAALKGETFVNKDGDVQTPWADEAHMVPDLRQEEAPKARGMAAAQPEVFDAETGERLIKIKPREYYRKAGGKKKGEPVPMDMGPANPAPDDKPVLGEHDDRVARSVGEEGDEEAADTPRLPTDDAEGLGDLRAAGSDDMGSDAGGEDSSAVAGGSAEPADVGQPSATDYLAALGMTPAAQVYDAPIGPEQPTRLGKRGDEGVILPAVAAE